MHPHSLVAEFNKEIFIQECCFGSAHRSADGLRCMLIHAKIVE